MSGSVAYWGGWPPRSAIRRGGKNGGEI